MRNVLCNYAILSLDQWHKNGLQMTSAIISFLTIFSDSLLLPSVIVFTPRFYLYFSSHRHNSKITMSGKRKSMKEGQLCNVVPSLPLPADSNGFMAFIYPWLISVNHSIYERGNSYAVWPNYLSQLGILFLYFSYSALFLQCWQRIARINPQRQAGWRRSTVTVYRHWGLQNKCWTKGL